MSTITARTNKMRTIIAFLLTHNYSLDAIVDLLKTEWDEKDRISWGGNSSTQYYHVDIGHERIWEGLLP